ncbi:MAG: ergothioneine biosynthesis protein EgtB [Noviherbaspirillum sp.]|nr:ergothioneine biosynthesis protein EgtB [Noviherbaspirillum sp.]
MRLLAADLPTAPHRLHADYADVRAHSLALSEPLSEEDCCVQSMPDASPIKWHLAHTTWFFETFILERFEAGFRPHHAAFRVLFNSYYNGVGEKHPRPQRGLLTRPSLAEVKAYRRDVDDRMRALLPRMLDSKRSAEIAALVELGLQHEKQHQELMLTDVKHLLSTNPLRPAYSEAPLEAATGAAPLKWQTFDAGIVELGHAGGAFCFDNETPRHRQFVEGFAIASRLVTNGEYQAFIKAGGYNEPALWLSEGWDWVRTNEVTKPIYWERDGAGWSEFTLHGQQPLDPHRPAVHIAYFEADAYARWARARLPTEAEWECAAATVDGCGEAAGGLHPHAAEGGSLTQLFGTAWQWTSSAYAPYPGYEVAEGAIGEYNGKFMVNQYVLRGSSCATPPRHTRATYRNFFPTSARWQFSGIRLAKS